MTIRDVMDCLCVFDPDMEVRIGVYQDKGCSYTYGISAARFLGAHSNNLGKSCVCFVEAHNDRKQEGFKMSNWTHVAGIVRIDAFGTLDTEKANDIFCKLFGKQLDFNDSSEKWEDAANNPQDYLPMGSEGSLKMSVWVNPNENSMAAYAVSIFGDLRDHDDPNAIIDWFKEKCTSNGLWIRNAVITARNDLNGTANWVYTEEEGE